MRTIFKYAGWLYRNSEGVRGSILANMGLGIITVCLNLLFVWISKLLVDAATGDVAFLTGTLAKIFSVSGQVPSGDDSWSLIKLLSILLIVLIAIRIVVAAIHTRLESVTYVKMNFIIRRRLYSSLMRAQWLGREKMHSGDALNRLFADVDTVTKVICNDFPSLITTAFQFVAAFVFLSMMDLRLALFVVLVTPALLAFSKIFFVRIRQYTRNIRQTESQVQSHVQESIQNRTVIQSLDNEGYAEGRLDNLQEQEYSQVLSRTRFSIFSRAIVSATFQLGYAAAFLWGIFGIFKGTATFGMMTAFLQLVSQIQNPAGRLTRQLPSLVYATTSVDRLMELESSEMEKTGEQIILKGTAGIRIDNLSFTYPDAQIPIFDGFTYDFAPGSKTAVVGETGVGKSTLIKLMLSLLRPTGGSISLYSDNGIDKAEVSALTRANLVYVPQGNSLFSGTVRDNLLIGNPNATESEMRAALETAAAEFVMQLPDGLDTVCGEKGSGLSEGQAQRIAIARSLLRPGSILLLDEFSSSLDPETEERLMENLTKSVGTKTMIFITHREKISEYCDAQLRLGDR